MRKFILLLTILVLAIFGWRIVKYYSPNINNIVPKTTILEKENQKVKIVTEESVVVDAVKKVGPSVVTIAEKSNRASSVFEMGPFSIFGLPDQQSPSQPQNIGSGFIISEDGIVVTNKHVVSDLGAQYQVVTNTDKKFEVQKIYRDPLNDIALLKVDTGNEKLKAIELGDSSNLQVGQMVVAIGTALGEFKNTVTTGVISGLGRGITAGSELQGFAEQLDNVIQTDAAINPGNSGGPLLNSQAQVIGINTAIAQGGQNIGFALPINVVKDSVKNFNETGKFTRAYLGVVYKLIDRDLSIANNLPEGAYVQSLVEGSPAANSGIQRGDIITRIDGKKISSEDGELAGIVAKKKVGNVMTLTVWREDENGNGKTQDIKVTLQEAPNQ